MQNETIIKNLLHALANKKIREAKKYIDPHVILHMDKIKVSGRVSWIRWVQYLHMHIKSMHIENLHFTHLKNKFIQVKGKVICEKKSGKQKENKILVKFYIKNDKIVEIISRRENYISIFGKSFSYKIVFYWHVLIITFYKILKIL